MLSTKDYKYYTLMFLLLTNTIYQIQNMNNFIVCMLVTAMYFGLNEACQQNRLQFHNHLPASRFLSIECNENNKTISHIINYKSPPYIIYFQNNHNLTIGTIWRCLLRQGPNLPFYFNLHPYHSRSVMVNYVYGLPKQME